MKCPTCRKPVKPRAENPTYPFCSQRCKAVDLGKWVGEEYRIPTRFADEQEDELPPAPGEGTDA
ncbi:MAG: DNA gyrase inhibitor YacG [Myxococcota bacterium]